MSEERTESHIGKLPSRRPFEYIAFWQFLGFLMLLALVWVNEILDLSALIYGPSASGIDWISTCILTACVIIAGFITIAHTFVQQQRVLRGIITICSYCHKVQLDREAWQKLDFYVAEKTDAEFSHGICPECYAKMLVEKGQLKDETPAGETVRATLSSKPQP